ncbi:MAG TPA: sugar ABC transporter permease [Ramlibacter sp.]|uniref:carbohydrate ABC transporter permease n=1 Tax=Ramlibacter sp. TaxID=1917967 RepID=UPI002C33D4D7|nr:sugar ABC transporter permease [Ramlibacter sp.]HVZ43533.1 sugar ABC transporter permease [Ramlibacter sp.]
MSAISLGGAAALRREAPRSRWRVALVAFAAPPLAYLVLWKIVPLLYTIYLSFTAWNPLRRPQPLFIGIANYVQAFEDTQFLQALLRTLLFTAGASVLELMLGLGFALLLDAKIRGGSFIRSLVLLPIVIAPAVVGTIWYMLFHDTIGPIAWLSRAVGLDIGWLRDPNIAMFSILLTDLWHWTPFMFLILLSGLQVIPRELYEAAAMDGAGAWATFRHVKLPLLKAAMLGALVLRSMDAFRIFDEIMLMTGGGPGDATTTTSVLIYRNAFKAFQLGYSSALVVVLLVVTAVLYLAYMRLVQTDGSVAASAKPRTTETK